jgi:hypothetical protein
MGKKEEARKSYALGDINKRCKNLLHIINETTNMEGPLKDLVHTYKYRKIIILWRFIMTLTFIS